jgi:hypothetical protein
MAIKKDALQVTDAVNRARRFHFHHLSRQGDPLRTCFTLPFKALEAGELGSFFGREATMLPWAFPLTRSALAY